MEKSIYLAIPYTGMEEKSFRIANKVAAKLISQGYIVFSPISHSHPIALAGNLDGRHGFWKPQNEFFIRACDEVLVIDIPGWTEKSAGVKWERGYALAIGKPVNYIDSGAA